MCALGAVADRIVEFGAAEVGVGEVSYAAIANRPDSFDLRLEYLTRLQENRWLANCPDTVQSPGEDQVAGHEGKNGRKLGNQSRHAEDEVFGPRFLHRRAVERASQCDVIAIGELFGRDDTRAERAVAASALSERDLWQAFAVLADIRSVGVMGDERTYSRPIIIRAVTSDDAITADWARIPYDVLATMSSRIVNEVKGVNRVAYDITFKPPETIEWE